MSSDQLVGVILVHVFINFNIDLGRSKTRKYSKQHIKANLGRNYCLSDSFNEVVVWAFWQYNKYRVSVTLFTPMKYPTLRGGVTLIYSDSSASWKKRILISE